MPKSFIGINGKGSIGPKHLLNFIGVIIYWTRLVKRFWPVVSAARHRQNGDDERQQGARRQKIQ
jgi:hypothetical protein